MEGRRIPGEGLAHEQEYIRERLEEGGDVDEYAEAADVLEQELADLHALDDSVDADGDDTADDSALRRTAGLPVERGATRQGDALDVTTDSVVDVEQLPPEDEARARMKSQLEGGAGGTSLGR